MEVPASYLEEFSKARRRGVPRSEWEETVDAFYHRINTPVSVKKYGEMTRSRVGKALKGKSPLAISQLFKECAKARSFCGLFRHLAEQKHDGSKPEETA